MDFSLPEIDGVLGTIKNNSSFIQRKSMEFKDAIVATVSNAGSIVDNLLKLTFLYVGVFLIQVIALPIMVFWALIKFANSLFDTNAPVILHHSRVSKNEIVSTINPADG
jgi:lipopolysaccharide/colanic/teichoic acid biosynthesis glycosyltransferase